MKPANQLLARLQSLTAPRAASDRERRQEYVLNVLLLGLLALTVTAMVQVLIGLAIAGANFQGASPVAVGVVMTCLLGLYGLSRQGYHRLSAYLLIAGFAAVACGVVWTWGVGLAAGSLIFVLVIVMSGTLVGSTGTFVVTGLVSVLLMMFAYLESQGIIQPNRSWMQQTAGVNDAFGIIFIWGIIMLVAWLSNREIERSLKRAEASEAALARQRDELELRVEERTRELKEAQLEKILQLNRFADFGRISSGFFHDIINPLTAVSLNLEQLSTEKRSALLHDAISGIKRIEEFAVAARKQVQGQRDEVRQFSAADEIAAVASVLENKARGAGVQLQTQLEPQAKLVGSAVKFHQVVSNLLANAIDAYDGLEGGNRVVMVSAAVKGKFVEIRVADHGAGIPPEHLAHIFDPFFTTKTADKGSGIGLLIVKRIVEQDFSGRIKVTSSAPGGTKFVVKLPAEVS